MKITMGRFFIIGLAHGAPAGYQPNKAADWSWREIGEGPDKSDNEMMLMNEKLNENLKGNMSCGSM